MTTGDPPIRIGTEERTAAMAALDEHLEKGRLGVEEYGDRSAAAANATVADDLAALFTDLPAPHPPLPGVEPRVPPPTAALPVVPVAGRRRFLDGWGPQLVAVTPFLALILFFVTKQWWWFLLVPIAGAFVYGGGAGRNPER